MRSLVLAALALSAFATTAAADPCRAISDGGSLPAYLHIGSSFTGPVPYVGDGDSFCVARGPAPTEWIEVRLADFYAPELHEGGGAEAKAALSSIVMGRSVTCRMVNRSYDRAVSMCWKAGVSVGDLMRRRGVGEGGRGAATLRSGP